AAPEELLERAQQDHVTIFWCPLGHKLNFMGESREEKLERQLRQERLSKTWYQDQFRASERSKAALKGHLTRARKKIAQGTCPVAGCGKHFSNVREHMRHMHPDWKMTDPETGEGVQP